MLGFNIGSPELTGLKTGKEERAPRLFGVALERLPRLLAPFDRLRGLRFVDRYCRDRERLTAAAPKMDPRGRSRDLSANPFQLHPTSLEHQSREAVLFAQQTQQQMLGPNVLV